MSDQVDRKTFVFRNFVNSFSNFYRDAKFFHQQAEKKEIADPFERVMLSRTALLLYIFSLEGLINRAMDHFLPEALRDYFLEREARLSVEEKWLLLPLLASEGQSISFDKSQYPWSHFVELIRLRNDFVHPKHDRAVYYRPITSHRWESLPWREIPPDLGVEETDVVYRQTLIPKNPGAIRLEHVDKAKKVVDDMVAELDRLLGGRILKEDWYISDKMELIYPPGAKLQDLPPDPNSLA